MEDSRLDFKYQSCYCEENIYLLGKKLSERLPIRQFHVLFISNSNGSVLLNNQRSKDNGIVVWDYHVILLHSLPNSSSIYDFDTRLSFPIPAIEYFTHSFPNGIHQEMIPLFRVIPLQSYLDYFSSDRSHMLSHSGEYLSPPPPWPIIQSPLALSSNQIPNFISMDPVHLCDISRIMSLDQIISFVKRDCIQEL